MLPKQLLNILLTQTHNNSKIVQSFWLGLLDSIPLYIYGQSADSSSIPLFIDGELTYSSILNLSTVGANVKNSNFNLFLRTLDWQSSGGGTQLFVEGTPLGVSGIRSDNIPAFIEGPSGSGNLNSSFPLYSFGNQTQLAASTFPLFLRAIGNLDGSITTEDSISLFMKNGWESISSGIDMFLQGPVGNSGTVLVNDSMNLFMARDSERIESPIPLYINGPEPNITDIPLFVEGGQTGIGSITGYIYGIVTEEGVISVFTRGF